MSVSLPPPRSARHAGWSIRLRLTLWSSVTIFLLLAVGTVATRVAIDAVLRAEFEASLDNQAALVQSFFRLEIAEHRSVEATALHLMTETLLADRDIAILRPGGAALPMDPARPVLHLTPPVRTVEAPLDAELAPGWRVRVRGSTRQLDETIASLDRWFGVGLAAGVLLSSLTGWMLTGRVLRPVRLMADAADAIGAGQSSMRLPVGNSGDELGRLARHINATLDRVDAALQQQRRFLADAAHELRTPIARMRSQVDLALLHEDRAIDARATLDLVARELSRTASFIGELLQLARVDAGERGTIRQRAFLDDVAVEALSAWRASAARAGVTLTMSRIEETSGLLDAPAISRLIGVLLDNAVRYTPAGGRVDLRVFPSGGRATLEVEDDGIGIPEADRARVFERFFRGAAARTAAPEGSGLGLAIARWIVAQHDGDIELTPSASGGTLARVTLPLAPAHDEGTRTPAAIEAAAG